MSKELVKVGDVSHFYTNIEVAVVDLINELKIGDKILLKGATTEFKQKVVSMQIEHDQITTAKAGDSIGLQVDQKVRAGDEVFKIIE
jgi:hypothetical protein